jgi:type II secretory pathway pseudopilin PulG
MEIGSRFAAWRTRVTRSARLDAAEHFCADVGGKYGARHRHAESRTPEPGTEYRTADSRAECRAANTRTAGFSLIEAVIVLSILAILCGALVPRVTNRLALSRDLQRLTDMRVLQEAIDKYCADHGHPPAAEENASYGEWDVSQDGDFIPELVAGGYLQSTPRDPLNDETYNYRYFAYEKGACGCTSGASFWVLGIRTFETADVALKNHGGFTCANRNWGDEFAYVIGGPQKSASASTATDPK